MGSSEQRDMPSSPLPERLLAILRRKWASRVLVELERGPRRFGALARTIPGLKKPVLAEELLRLARDGLVRRQEVSLKPRQVSYALTPAGTSFFRLLRYLNKWEARHLSPQRPGPRVSGHFKMTT